jgi:hypothetical protein
MVFDRVSWSDTPAFHNTLVVGSSPTSSTTQSAFWRLLRSGAGGLTASRGPMRWMATGAGKEQDAELLWALLRSRKSRKLPRLGQRATIAADQCQAVRPTGLQPGRVEMPGGTRSETKSDHLSNE